MRGIHSLKLQYKGVDFDWKKDEIQKRIFVLEKDNELHRIRLTNLEEDMKNLKRNIDSLNEKTENNRVEIINLKKEMKEIEEKEEEFANELRKSLEVDINAN